MHILILGAGALGTLLGSRLVNSNVELSLLSRNRAHVDKIQNHGLFLEELDGSEKHISLSAYHDPAELSFSPDLVLVAVKSYDTAQAVYSIQEKCHTESIFLTLQNGIGNWETIAKYISPNNILAGTTAQGATFVEPGRIRHGGNGITVLGELNGEISARLKRIIQILQDAGLECKSTSRVHEILWHKMLINVGINALTGLLEVRNGSILQRQDTKSLSGEAVLEAVEIARAQGISVPENPVQEVLNVAKATSWNKSSMFQDILKGKPTEIDAMNGAIQSKGNELGIPTPVNWTLTRLIKSKQELKHSCESEE